MPEIWCFFRDIKSINPKEFFFSPTTVYSCSPQCHNPNVFQFSCPPLQAKVTARSSILLKGVWREQHLSSGKFQFRCLWITWNTRKRGNPHVSRSSVALHKHRIQASNFGSKESVNTVKHSEEVRELQLLKETHKYWFSIALWLSDNHDVSLTCSIKHYLCFDRFGLLILE